MIDRNKILKCLLTLAGIFALVILLSNAFQKKSMTLEEYAKNNPDIAYMKKPEASPDITSAPPIPASSPSPTATPVQEDIPKYSASSLIGVSLNKNTEISQRITYEDNFYYEPLSENLCRYITGISFPSIEGDDDAGKLSTNPYISYDDLRYVHIMHYNFDGNPAEGELICNQAIAQDIVEIFYELYQNEYHIEKVLLIDEYNGDDTASMEDNNTSCFNYREVAGSTSLSKHAYGLAIDINPLYNPYITYEKNETGAIISENVSPASAAAYADRTSSFPYKIDENDLCCRLFMEHGFTWGGNWNSCKDYQHFQKTVD